MHHAGMGKTASFFASVPASGGWAACEDNPFTVMLGRRSALPTQAVHCRRRRPAGQRCAGGQCNSSRLTSGGIHTKDSTYKEAYGVHLYSI